MVDLRACLSVSGALMLAALFGTAPRVHAQEDASRATPPPGKALVFVLRSEREPVAEPVPTFVNLARAGDLANGTFVVATVNPGRTFLRIGEQVLSLYSLEAAADQSYFVLVEAVPGVKPVRTEVRLVSEVEGRALIAKSRLAGTAPPPIAAAPRAQPQAAPVAALPRAQPLPAPAVAVPAPAPAAAPPPPPPAPAPIAAAPPRVQPPPPPAKRAPEPEPEEPSPFDEFGSDWKLAFIAGGGTFKMANNPNTIATLPSTFDRTSSPVLSLQAELRSKGGFAAGGEVFYYKNDLVTNPGTVAAAVSKQQVVAIMGNAKYYFHATDWFYPFVGGGVGFAEALYSGGNLKGYAGGFAYQGLAGMEFRFGRVGLNVQYKYLSATTGKSDKEVKIGGAGILAGVSFAF